MKNSTCSKIGLAVLTVFVVSAIASAGDELPMPPEPPDLVLVLSGGGARGAAHIGVLRVLEELHVAPDLIVGTSMGSIVGGLYAAGWSPDEIEELLVSIDWNQVFTDKLPRSEKSFRRKQDDRPYLIPVKLRFGKGGFYLPSGLLGGQSLELLLRTLEARSQPAQDFDDLPVPYRAVAADLEEAEPFVIGSGSLATAMRASMAIPGMFAPVVIDGKELADGGSVANLPVGLAQQLGGKRIIAVDITSPLSMPGDKLTSFFDVYSQTNSMVTVQNRREDVERLSDEDVYIRPDLGDISFLAFDKAEDAVSIGTEAAIAQADQLKKFSLPEKEWQEYLLRQRRPPSDLIEVDRIRLENESRLSDAIQLRALNIEPPTELDPSVLRDDIMRMHHLQPSGVTTFEVELQGNEQEMGITSPHPPFGRNSLQFGLGFVDDFQGETGYSVSARHQMLPVNRKAGEWQNFLQIGSFLRIASDFYQPISTDLKWFVTARGDYSKYNQNIWFDGDPIATYRIGEATGRIGGGRVLGNWGDLAVTGFLSENRGELRVGDPFFPDVEEKIGGLEFRFRVDTEDAVVFPRSGISANLDFTRSFTSFGSDRDLSRLHGFWLQALSFGEFTVQPYAEYGENFESGGDFFDLFFLGGLGRLSGLGLAELYGEKLAFARLLSYRRLKRIDLAGIRIRVYAGMGLEAGNVFDFEDSVKISDFLVGGNIFIGAETPLGPLYLAYGYTEGGNSRWYLAIGDHF